MDDSALLIDLQDVQRLRINPARYEDVHRPVPDLQIWDVPCTWMHARSLWQSRAGECLTLQICQKSKEAQQHLRNGLATFEDDKSFAGTLYTTEETGLRASKPQLM